MSVRGVNSDSIVGTVLSGLNREAVHSKLDLVESYFLNTKVVSSTLQLT